jgi:hypothetical protein
MIEEALIETEQMTPCISMIISTDKSYPHYKLDEARMKSLLKKLEKELVDQFPEKEVQEITKKLHKLISEVDHKHLSKALAIYASPNVEKIVYLPFSAEERYIIDSSFEVRDLLYSATNSVDYLVLLLDNHNPEIYYGYNTVLVKSNINEMPDGIEDVKRDYPTRVFNFTDIDDFNEINLDKYLRQIDYILSDSIYDLEVPVIVCGVKRAIGHFKKITKNAEHIIDYVEGNYNHNSTEEIYKAIEGSLLEKREQDQQEILDDLEEAMSNKRCVFGIANVWTAAQERKGGLLVVERDYACKAKIGSDKYDLILDDLDIDEPYVTLKDAVDDIIELVVKSRGDIVFVNNGKLEQYNKIALITYY